ncbi:TPA: hypothetical protein N0F65_007855 [Lagenidium giganteum]|uniref:Uncharacterized protein n=1 Tax=Lagenidium giganteum TaxID=4803 RepID=A0AAV2YE11_9STRA|nr:TPA: hypothetical protein N0F65_007855 [Lagenidium giganteum]
MQQPPGSPTWCRPHHLDRERLRAVLTQADYADVRYHEAVVVVVNKQPKAFKLLAVAGDALLVFSLASTQPGGAPLRVPFSRVIRIDQVSPSLTKQRGMMIHSESLLFRVVARPAKTSVKQQKAPPNDEYFISTFERGSQVAFYLTRAHSVYFQTRILRSEAHGHVEVDNDDAAELVRGVLAEISAADDRVRRSALITELAVAMHGSAALKRLFFVDKTSFHIAGRCKEVVVGVPAFVVGELQAALTAVAATGDALEYILSLFQLLSSALFDGYAVPQRIHFLQQWDFETALNIAMTRPIVDRKRKNDALVVLEEDIMEEQLVLLLELEAAQQDLDLASDGAYFRSTKHVCRAAVESPRFPEFFKKFLKRLAIVLSRSPAEVPGLRTRGSRWSLAMWRYATLLDLFFAVERDEVTQHVLAHQDRFNMYVRNHNFLDALRSSTVPHLLQAADKIARAIELIDQEEEQSRTVDRKS